MKWQRLRPGSYWAGPYTVEMFGRGGTWRATGPCVATELHDTKADAQSACYDAMHQRLGDPYRVDAVVGDIAVMGGVRVRITAVLTGADGKPLFCAQTSRGKRKCQFRYEFPLVLP